MTLWKRYRLQDLADGSESTSTGASGAPAATQSPAGSTPNVPAGDTAQATQAQAPDSGVTPPATPTAKPDEGGSDGATAAKVAPETYEFKLPEGITLDQEVIGELSGISKEIGLTQEQADKFAGLGVKLTQKFEAQQAAALETLSQEWLAQSAADTTVGGDKLPMSQSLAKEAIVALKEPELAELLEKSRLGNHPAVLRFMSKVGKMVSQDNKLVTGMAPNQAFASTAQRMYPGMNP
jgi:hypothetical protein